jgi:ribokinase
MKLDFLAIGDTVVDEFIFLKEATVTCDTEGRACAISMRWGDKIPFEDAILLPAVGNSANGAVAAARIGLSAGLVANIGIDRDGDDCVALLEKEGISPTTITRHKDVPTNHHYVLSFQSERTILIKHEIYPYVFPKEIAAPKTIYLSSLADGTEEYHDAVADYAEAHPEILFAFQPGTFQIRFGKKRLARLYQRADIFFCNVEEAQRILISDEKSVQKLAEAIHALGPKKVCITDGRNGAYALENDTFLTMPLYPDPRPPVERTGAGDAFSSTTTAYVAMGYSLKDAMKRGSINAAYVVQDIGAQRGLLTKEKLEEFAANWTV